MSHFVRRFLAAAACASATLFSAGGEERLPMREVTLAFAFDADRTPEETYADLRLAAKAACYPGRVSASPRMMRTDRNCQERLVEQVVAGAGRPALAAVHAAFDRSREADASAAGAREER